MRYTTNLMEHSIIYLLLITDPYGLLDGFASLLAIKNDGGSISILPLTCLERAVNRAVIPYTADVINTLASWLNYGPRKYRALTFIWSHASLPQSPTQGN